MRIDGRVIDRPSALVRAGSVISYPANDDIIVVRVEGLAERRGPYEEARHLYSDLTQRSRGRTETPADSQALTGTLAFA